MSISINNNFYNIYNQRVSFKSGRKSKKTLQDFKYEKTPKVAMQVFTSDKITNTYKELMWKLSEIPYFNAVAKNLKPEELEKLLSWANRCKPFFEELLAGNILIFDKNSGKTSKVVDLEKIAKQNLNRSDNPKNLYLEILHNEMAVEVLMAATIYKLTNNSFASGFLMKGESISGFNFNNSNNYNETICDFLEYVKSADVEDEGESFKVVYFKNNLDEVKDKTVHKKNNNGSPKKSSLNKLEYLPPPVIVQKALLSEMLSNKYKKILYEWGDIPYMYAALTGISNENLVVLLAMDDIFRNKKSENVFRKILNGRVTVGEDKDGAQKRKVFDLKQEVRTNYPRNYKEGLSNLNFALQHNIMVQVALFEHKKWSLKTDEKIDSIGYFLNDKYNVVQKIVLKDGKKTIYHSPDLEYLPEKFLDELFANESNSLIFEYK